MKQATFICIISLTLYGLTPGLAVGADNINKLFFTPAQRAVIDASKNIVNTKPKANTKPLKQTQRIEVKGYLKRKGQPDVVWVNSNNTLKSNKPLEDVKVLKLQKSSKVKLKVRGKGIVKLKPGQVITRTQKPVQDVYEKSQ